MITTVLAMVFTSATYQYNLPPGLIKAICLVESSNNPSIVHKDDGTQDSLGLCQLHLSTARMMGFKGKEKDLFNPWINAHFAGAYIRHQLDRYRGDVDKAIIAYNSGHYDSNNVQYLKKVKKAWKINVQHPNGRRVWKRN